MIDLPYLKQLLAGRTPQTAVILGSGLGKIADRLSDRLVIKYADIPGFPQTTVRGHNGQMIIGNLNGKEVLCMQGRFHLYEGHQPSIINEVIQALKYIGITELVVTNASGSLNYDIAPGEIMLISDHINFSGRNPLIGPQNESCFVDMSNAYDSGLQQKAMRVAERCGIKLHRGVYLMVLGPNFETAAEIRAFRLWGADAVGMSTVPEVISAVNCGIKVVAFSAISNYGTGMTDAKPSHAETLTVASQAADKLAQLITAYLNEED